MPKFIKVAAPLLLIAAGSFAYYGTEEGLETAKGLLGINAAVDAEERILSVLEANPYDIEAWTLLGNFYFEAARLEEALEAYERALDLSAGDVAIAVRHAGALIRLGRADEAESRALEIRKKYPENVDALHILGWIAIKRAGEGSSGLEGTFPNPERLSDAEIHFQEAIRIDPADAEGWLGRAVIARMRGKHVDAIPLLERSIAIDSAQYWAWHLLGNELAALGRDDEAARAYHEAQALASGRPYSLLELAAIARQNSLDSTAAGYLARVGPAAAYNRGIDLMNARNLAEAERAFMEALLVNPEDGLALDRLEQVRIDLYPASDTRRVELAGRRVAAGARAEAVNNSLLAFRSYRRAIRLAPQLSEARLEMAKFLDREGAYAAAVTELQRVEELTRSQNERLIANDLLEVITRKALSEMESVHNIDFGAVWEQPTSALGELIGNPETLEARVRWGVNPIPRPRVRIAILPFEEAARPIHNGIGRLGAVSLATTLLLLPGFDLVPQDEIDRAAAIRMARTPGDVDPGILGRDLGADIVVRGRILERDERIDLTIEAIRVPAGPVVWSANYVFEGPDVFDQAVLEIARGISAAIPLEGMVIRREGQRRITVNLGRVHGMSVGDTLTILRRSNEFFVEGLDWPGRREEPVMTARVVGLTERYAEIEPIGETIGAVRAGDVVRRIIPAVRESAITRLLRR